MFILKNKMLYTHENNSQFLIFQIVYHEIQDDIISIQKHSFVTIHHCSFDNFLERFNVFTFEQSSFWLMNALFQKSDIKVQFMPSIRN
jgi:hypothetical protein